MRPGRRVRLAAVLLLGLHGPAGAPPVGAETALSQAVSPRLVEGTLPTPARTTLGLPGAPLWDHRSAELEAGLQREVRDLGFGSLVHEGRLAVALVDISQPARPRVAALNGDRLLYAASLPKIAVLLATYQHAHDSRRPLDVKTRRDLLAMIRASSNPAATRLMHRVTKPFIAEVLRSPRYALYDPKHGGGLWAGKDYGKAGLWRRDPIGSLSHAATAMQVARFFYLLDTDQLVTPAASREMKHVLGVTSLEHKFVLGLRQVRPRARIYRKSGSWRTYHADGAIVERRDGARYIAVALADHQRGARMLPRIIVSLDRLIGAPELRAATN